MMHWTIWPEGLPDLSRRFTSWWRMQARFSAMHLSQLLRPASARRLRVASCREGFADPHRVEDALKARGAIPPPGGWHEGRLAAAPSADAPKGDVLIRTHSVV